MNVLLADDETKVRSALRLLLEQQPDCYIVGEAEEAQSLLEQVEVTQPDVVLLDWELPGLQDLVPAVQSGSLGTRSAHERLLLTLRKVCSRVKVIALSGRPEARAAALGAGADAFVSKGDPPEQLMTAVNDCWRGREQKETFDE